MDQHNPPSMLLVNLRTNGVGAAIAIQPADSVAILKKTHCE